MNSKMTTNSQLSTNEPKKKKRKRKTIKTKQTTTRGTESETWMLRGGFSVGSGRGGMGEKVQGRRIIIDRHKIDGKR